MNYVLIGMPGSGKTTIGNLLAEQLNYDFVDSDHYLEANSEETIPEMFAKSEAYFRSCETKVIKEISMLKQTVIATGGGVILNKENMLHLKKNGLIIFLDRSPDLIMSDISNHERPLLAEDKNRLYNLYEERIDLYHQYADIVIANDDRSDPESVVASIIKQISNSL